MVRISASGSSPKPLERVMIFIDGGYIRRIFSDLFGDDNIHYWRLRNDLQKWYNAIPSNPFRANLIRAYYYDGIADESEAEYQQQRAYFDNLRESCVFMNVSLAEAVKQSDGSFRQKGVDVLLAIDSLSMAYLDIYDSGLFLLGDRDFIPLIEAIKATGKKTFGFLYKRNVSEKLRWTFDYRIILNKEKIASWHSK
jgi:uncharacterized LabA/DUF88 family protein